MDELYEALLLRPFRALCAFAAEVDRIVVDGLVNLAGVGAEFAAQGFKFVQTGFVRHYALWLLGGAVAVIWIVVR